jgi:hypothetical protein
MLGLALADHKSTEGMGKVDGVNLFISPVGEWEFSPRVFTLAGGVLGRAAAQENHK